MTDFVHIDGVATSAGAHLSTADGQARIRPLISPLVIAEAARSAAGLPLPDGARLLIELALAGGGWTAGALAGSVASGSVASGVVRTRASSGPLADLADQLQWEHGEGPTHDVLRADAMTEIVTELHTETHTETAADTAADTRWPRWAPAARDMGVHAAMAIRLHVGRPVGALTLYASAPATTGRSDLQLIQSIAAQLSILVDAADTRHHLERALGTRTTIGQAVGILMHRHGLPSDRAFGLLRRVSQHRNVRIATLAIDLVEKGVLPTTSATGLEPRAPIDGR